jgi:hypothetical protein
MAAHIVDTVVLRDPDAGVKLSVSADREGGVDIEITLDDDEPRLLSLGPNEAAELASGIRRALKASGASE